MSQRASRVLHRRLLTAAFAALLGASLPCAPSAADLITVDTDALSVNGLGGGTFKGTPFSTQVSIHVAVAEVVPRYDVHDARGKYPDFFSPLTYWHSDDLWKYIGVPFEVVTAAIQEVAAEFRGQLISGLRGLLPKDEAPFQQRLFGDTE